MPEVDATQFGEEESAAATATTHHLPSLLASDGRDFLLRNNGDQVKISDLDSKIVGLYFSASWCGPCRRFTPKLVETYNELLSSKDCKFEIVFVSADEDEDSFAAYFSKMPWLAVPFSDSNARAKLDSSFNVRGIPHLVILDVDRKALLTDGTRIVMEYGPEGYPFTVERIRELEEEEETAKKNQTLRSLLVSPSRDFVISEDKNQVPVSDLEGKVIGLYFSVSSSSSCVELSKSLKEMYLKLKENGENFEVVQVNLDDKEPSGGQGGSDDMPWLAIPFKDKMCEKLARYFELRMVPTLVIIGSDGKTQLHNAVELVEDHGIEAYPFTPSKLEEIAEKEKMMRETQTLESVLVSRELDYVIGKDGIVIPVSELVGKNILLYFGAQWFPPCRTFLPKLIEAYNKIREKEAAFEIIFVSNDMDESSFSEHFSEMPWLALPFEDGRKRYLMRRFKIDGPSLVVIGPTGKTITTEAKELVVVHGAAAYPFTEERRRELEAQIEETAKAWPEKIKHKLHEHELVKCRRQEYNCDHCDETRSGWSFYCKTCDFDLDPKCALEGDEVMKTAGSDDEDVEEGGIHEPTTICDGEVCYKA